MELEGPARVIAMLLSDRLDEQRTETRMGAGVRRDLACESRERVGRAARGVPPALNRLEREADGLSGGRMTPGSSGELVDARLELPVVGGGGHQRPKDLTAQACPAHARARRARAMGTPALSDPWASESAGVPI